jgi:hypothetical protein
MMRWVAGLLAFALVGVAGCRLQSDLYAQTQLVVDIDAEVAVRLKTQQVHVIVTPTQQSGSAFLPIANATPLFSNDYTTAMSSGEHWPVRLTLLPQSSAGELFTVTATAIDGSGAFVAEVSVASGYTANEVHYLRLLHRHVPRRLAGSRARAAVLAECGLGRAGRSQHYAARQRRVQRHRCGRGAARSVHEEQRRL